MRKRRKVLVWFCILLISSMIRFQWARDLSSTDASLSQKTFRIGYIASSGERVLNPSWFDGLRKFLLGDEEIQNSMSENGFDTIAVLPADGVNDMVRRMDHYEFHLVFLNAMAYVIQSSDYKVILQWRRASDTWDPRGKGALQTGVVFVNNRSPLFKKTALTKSGIREYIAGNRMAFISASSAVGYISPRVKMSRDLGLDGPLDYVFCDYSEEVVKYVISGLVDIGCCEKSALGEVLEKNGLADRKENLVKVLFETEPVPTAPIATLSSLHPSWEVTITSQLGKLIKERVKAYVEKTLSSKSLAVESTSDKSYENLKEVVREFSDQL